MKPTAVTGLWRKPYDVMAYMGFLFVEGKLKHTSVPCYVSAATFSSSKVVMGLPAPALLDAKTIHSVVK